MVWTYRIGGLGVRSDVALPCHDQAVAAIDVAVELVSAWPETQPGGPRAWMIDGQGARLALPQGIGLHIQAPGRIAVAATTEHQRDQARLYLPGLAFSMLFLLRASLPLHAGAVALGGRAFLFLGPSGAGKSTLTAAFSTLDGAVVLADDLAVPEWRDGWPVLWPTFPGLRLLPDAAAALQLSGTPTADGKQWLAAPVPLGAAPLPLAGLFLLGPREAEQAIVVRLSATAALPALLRELKGNVGLDALPTRQALYAQAARLCSQTPVYRIGVPVGVAGLGAFCRHLAELGLQPAVSA